MPILLQLKNWQLLLIILGTRVGSTVLTILHLPIEITTIGFLIRLLWDYTVAKALQEKLPVGDEVDLRTFMTLFYVQFGYTLMTYVFSVIAVFFELPDSIINMYEQLDQVKIGSLTFVMIMNFIFAIFFAMNLAKLLNTVERQRESSFSEYGGDIFLFIFLGLGIWWLQPRIQKLVGNDDNDNRNSGNILDRDLTQRNSA